jgi:hypothetical protein
MNGFRNSLGTVLRCRLLLLFSFSVSYYFFNRVALNFSADPVIAIHRRRIHVNQDHATFAEFMGILEERVFYGDGSLSLGRRRNLTQHEIEEIIGDGDGEGEEEEEEAAAPSPANSSD